jgi:hypothetical protein
VSSPGHARIPRQNLQHYLLAIWQAPGVEQALGLEPEQALGLEPEQAPEQAAGLEPEQAPGLSAASEPWAASEPSFPGASVPGPLSGRTRRTPPREPECTVPLELSSSFSPFRTFVSHQDSHRLGTRTPHSPEQAATLVAIPFRRKHLHFNWVCLAPRNSLCRQLHGTLKGYQNHRYYTTNPEKNQGQPSPLSDRYPCQCQEAGQNA